MSEAAIGIRLTEERTSAEAKQLRMKKAKEAGNRDEFAINLPCPTPARNAEPVSQHGGPSVDDDGQWSQVCTGWGWASIQTWELAIQYGFTDEYLNETYLETDWDHYRHWWGSEYFLYSSYGYCWANFATFFNTHWYTASCLPIATTTNGGYFDQQKTGSYVNVDFALAICAATSGLFCPWPFPALAQTTTTAAVQYAYGQANWGTSFNINTDYDAYTCPPCRKMTLSRVAISWFSDQQRSWIDHVHQIRGRRQPWWRFGLSKRDSVHILSRI